MEVVDGRAARRGLLLLVGEGDARRFERCRGRDVLGVGGIGVVPRLLDLLAQRLLGVGQHELLVAQRELGQPDVVARGTAVEDRNREAQPDVFAAVVAELGPEPLRVAAVDARAVSAAKRERRVECRAGDRHRVLGACEPEALGAHVRPLLDGHGVDLVGRPECVHRGERHAVEPRGGDVEARGALAVERLAQVKQRQLQVVARLREAQGIVRTQGLALVVGRFGLPARVDQLAAACRLLRAQGQLPLGDADHLAAVEHLQVERHDVHGDILAGAVQIRHGGREVEFRALDLTVDAQTLEQGHARRDAHRPRGLVVAAVGVVGGQRAAEREVGADRGVEVRQAAEAGRRERRLLLLDLQGALLHADVVALGIADAVVERPRRTRSRQGRQGRVGALCVGGFRRGGGALCRCDLRRRLCAQPLRGEARDQKENEALFHVRSALGVISSPRGRRGSGRRPSRPR